MGAAGHVCYLVPKKDPVNEENKYGQNFRNLFCYCHQEYDPEKESRSMVKCVLCEDWFHEDCITMNPLPPGNQDFVCRDCTARFPVLKKYANNGLVTGNAEALEKRNSGEQQKPEQPAEEKQEGDEPPKKRQKVEEPAPAPVTSSSSSSSSSAFSSSSSSTAGECKIASVPDDPKMTELFCNKGWREALCRCDSCFILLDNLGIRFLIEPDEKKPPFSQPPLGDDEDADEDGEELDVEGGAVPPRPPRQPAGEVTSVFEGGINALNTIPQPTVVDIATATNMLGERLREFFRTFAEQNKVVTKEDITEFFEQLKREGPPAF